MQIRTVMYDTSARFARKNDWIMFAILSGDMEGMPSRRTRFLRNDCTAVIASAALVPWPWMSPSTYR